MEGVADGAGVPLVDIVVLNARSEIALGTVDDGCTSLSWEIGSDRGEGYERRQILAQNWDWTEAVGDNLVLMSIEQQGKPKIWMVTEPGILGKIGFNSSSVGVCLNAIRARSISTSLLPIHLLLRVFLECNSVTEAISELERLGGPGSSQHVLIAHAGCDTATGSYNCTARGLEVSPLGNSYIEPDSNGIIVHTNHFLQNKYVEEIPWQIGSVDRLERIKELLGQLKGDDEQINASTLRRTIFSDKQGGPYSICCNAVSADGRALSTLFNIIMTFIPGKQPKAEVLFGKPDAEDGKGEEVRLVSIPW